MDKTTYLALLFYYTSIISFFLIPTANCYYSIDAYKDELRFEKFRPGILIFSVACAGLFLCRLSQNKSDWLLEAMPQNLLPNPPNLPHR
jgi:hypothetical protein